jgi:uncharacterized membrane protein (UPF0136 family)
MIADRVLIAGIVAGALFSVAGLLLDRVLT